MSYVFHAPRLQFPMTRFLNLFSKKSAAVATFILVLLALLPTLKLGLTLDDYFHFNIINQTNKLADSNHWLSDTFVFFNGDSQRSAWMIREYGLPWWTYEEIKVAFWRPLSTLTMWLDYRVIDSNGLRHLHSVIWYLVLCVSVYIFLTKFVIDKRLVTLASFIFALNMAQYPVVAWLAARNGIIAVIFGLLCILFHHQWRSQNKTIYSLLSSGVFLLALLSGEAAVATGAYLFSYCLFLEKQRGLGRWLPLVPCIIIGLLWLGYYQYAGYGAKYSGFYLTSDGGIITLIGQIAKNAILLFFAQWSGVHTELFMHAGSDTITTVLAIAIPFSIVLFYCYKSIFKNNNLAHFFFLGGLMAILPACMATPQLRVLIFSNIGASALFAYFIILAFGYNKPSTQQPDDCNISTDSNTRIKLIVKLFSGYLFVIHVVLYPLAFFAFGSSLLLSENKTVAQKWVEKLPFEGNIEDKKIIFINPPGLFSPATMRLHREMLGLPVAKQRWLLFTKGSSVNINPTAPNALEVEFNHSFFAKNRQGSLGLLFRGQDKPFSRGHSVTIDDLKITVMDIFKDGFPRRVEYRFKHRLDHQDYVFLKYYNGQFEPYDLPQLKGNSAPPFQQ